MPKKPCSICRCWFEPNRRAGSRQRVCSSEACQRERQRRAVAAWRKRHPDYDKENRLRKRLAKAGRAEPAPPDGDPLAGLDWSAARNAVGFEVSVVIEESGKVIANWARNAVGTKVSRQPGQSAKVLGEGARNAIAARGRPP